jgi:hypothetical protein
MVTTGCVRGYVHRGGRVAIGTAMLSQASLLGDNYSIRKNALSLLRKRRGRLMARHGGHGGFAGVRCKIVPFCEATLGFVWVT